MGETHFTCYVLCINAYKMYGDVSQSEDDHFSPSYASTWLLLSEIGIQI